MEEVHEENGCGGDDDEEEGEEEEDNDDHSEEWDEDDEPCNPYIRYLDPPVSRCTMGAMHTIDEAWKIVDTAYERQYKLNGEWCDLVDNNVNPRPLGPLFVLPKITTYCASGDECYHLEYWTEITSETSPAHPYFTHCGMMQVFSLILSSPLAHQVNIYGTFAVRDAWEPLRNYLFKRSRDGPATISPGCSFLPLCSPSRGIYVLQHFLIDIDLWIKEEGDASADKPLVCGYVEMDTSAAGFERKLGGRFQGDCYGLDMHFTYMGDSIETAIEVIAEAEHPSEVKMIALTSGYDYEIALYDGTFSGTGVMFKHFVAVKKLEQLHVLMKLDGSLYKWTFQAGVGVIVAT
ncbi:hypothetical protein EJB05_57152 [Eragrostis curvula]|uniref:DUF6598 domain-containing protein n=1 Tax=Eragrostis curvula TaxID=38414 RepID=A0A5J9SE68_9POAL|nr:hypothetical protein EJB05_57152 [Eragrostis curvula]